MPRVVDPAEPFAGLGRHPPGGLHVAGEVGQHALREEQRRVGLVVLEVQPRQGRARGRQVTADRGGPGQARADQPVQGAGRDPRRLGVRLHGARVAQGHQQVPTPRQQDRQVVGTGVLAYAVDEGQRVAVGAQRSGDLHGLDDVRHRARGESGGEVVVGDPARRALERGQRLRHALVSAGPLVRRQLLAPVPRGREGAGSGSRPRRARPPGPPTPAPAGRRSRPPSRR